jgi:hypothetical protein
VAAERRSLLPNLFLQLVARQAALLVDDSHPVA